jgi:hypothetical protein
MYEQLPKEEEKQKEQNVKFADWALTQVPQGEFMENYYKLLKQFEEEYGRVDKN